MTFSLVFLVHTAILLGQGQLAQYGVNTPTERKTCENELFRTARLLQDTDDGPISGYESNQFEQRIEHACYNNRAAE